MFRKMLSFFIFPQRKSSHSRHSQNLGLSLAEMLGSLFLFIFYCFHERHRLHCAKVQSISNYLCNFQNNLTEGRLAKSWLKILGMVQKNCLETLQTTIYTCIQISKQLFNVYLSCGYVWCVAWKLADHVSKVKMFARNKHMSTNYRLPNNVTILYRQSTTQWRTLKTRSSKSTAQNHCFVRKARRNTMSQWVQLYSASRQDSKNYVGTTDILIICLIICFNYFSFFCIITKRLSAELKRS